MKRIAIILLTLSTLTAQFLFAQTCPATASYSNQSGTFDLTAGKTIVLNNGGSYQITIQNTFSSTSSICVLNGSTVVLQFQNVNTMQSGGSIYTDKTSKITFTGNSVNSFPLTLTNAGTIAQTIALTFTDGAVVNNSGTYTMSAASTISSGAISFTNSGTFDIKNSLAPNSNNFTFTNTAAGTVTFSNTQTLNTTAFINAGTVRFNALLLQNSSTITNNGYIYVTNTGSNSLFLSSTSTVNNNGVIYVYGSIVINSGNTLTNNCTLRDSLDFSNDGTVNNNGSLLLTVNKTSTLKNQGTFTNGTSASVQGTSFTNIGTTKGGGNFYFSGTTLNQGSFTGGDNKINFYDATNTSGKYFDTQNTDPVNTTKNQISPNTSTSFTSCSDVSAPSITAQPQTQILCTSTTTEAKFSVTATSKSTPSYQWYKNEKPISGATASVLSLTNLTLADTANFYNVVVTNTVGSVWSNSVYIRYMVVSSPSSLYLATGNAATFSVVTSGAVKRLQWQKDGVDISGATSTSYSLAVVNQSDSGSYKASFIYDGGTCASDAATLKTSIILYAKSTGDLNVPATWGVATDGSGSNPVNFTRDEHTFIVANRATAATASSLTIAGKLDLANATVTITPGTTLTVGRITRAGSSTSVRPTGVLSVSSTTNLSVTGIATTAYAGASDLYFDAKMDTLKNLTIAAHTVTLRTALNITAGSSAGVVTINSGTLATSDLLTLKSDVNGTGSIGSTAGTITGKVTIEKFIHARRAWRLMGAPVSSVNASSINAAWQEGATKSTANPNPGFGTHITYGLESEGFDQNPQKTFSMKVRNSSGAWVGVPATNKTLVTDYPAYFIFIRGDRSYDITGTTSVTTPTTTILRVTGNVNQGTQAVQTVAATGFTLVSNPYACPINFTKLKSSNVKSRVRVWDPTLAGAKGVGGYVIIDGSTGVYKATPSSKNVSTLLQAGQGFFVESSDGVNSGSIVISEGTKDLSGATLGADRVGEADADTSLAINLKLFNEDGTTAIADGVLYNFNAAFNDSVDNHDAAKMNNFGENLAISENSKLLTIDNRTAPKEGDSLHLNLTNAKNASYQLEIIPASLNNQSLSLFDKYLNTFSPISSTDTTRITFSVNTSVEASKVADRFTIVAGKPKVKSTVLPTAGISSVKAYAKDKAIQVEWTVSNESGIAYYEVQKSVDGSHFSAAANVLANGASAYLFTDAKPAAGINYYRVKSVNKNGTVTYTNIVNAQVQTTSATGAASVGVYPNPLTGSAFTLTLSNLEAGTYTLSVVNSNGAVQFSKSISHNGGTASQKISLSHTLAAGIYYVKVVAASGTVNMVKIIAQ